MSLGWFDNLNDAENYFNTERLIKIQWDSLTNNDMKESAVTMAYNRIFYSPDYVVPTYALATPDQLVILKKANGEMAYYLAEHLYDEDTRKNLQAQGVIEAGIVKEKYHEDMMKDLPIPPFVHALLEKGDFFDKTSFKIVELERDMNEDILK